jgi:hypothetical protein
MQSKYEAYIEGMQKIMAQLQQDLDALGAIDMQAEQEFVGYIRHEPDGRFSNEIHSWGVNYGKVCYGDTIEAVKAMAFEIFG